MTSLCMLKVNLCLDSCTSSLTCQLISVIITTLIIRHSFTLSLQAQNLPFQQILPTLILLPWTDFTITGPDRTYRASRFIFSSFFSFFCLFRVVDKAAGYESAFYCTLYTLSYRNFSIDFFVCDCLLRLNGCCL